jgi:hypothetical protein
MRHNKPKSVVRVYAKVVFVIFSETLAASRGIYILFCEGLRHLSPSYVNVPKMSYICPQRYSMRLPGSLLRRSLSYRFSICFPSFSLCETEKDGKTIE